MTQKPPLPPRFHIANIQNLLSEEGMFIKQLDKINFLRDQCKEENPYFLAFAETWIKDGILESEYTIYGYEHVASHRKNRDGGGVIIYIREDITYNFLTAVSDEMCSMVAVHLTKLNLIIFLAYRPPPNHKNDYHGDTLERSFKDIIIDNICKEINKHKTPTPDILLIGDFNFPRAQWNAGIGVVKPDSKCNRNSLQQLINIASDYSLLQYISEGTRETRKGGNNILELIFTNNHELITNIHLQPSEITDHKYIVCETSYKLPINVTQHISESNTNLSSYNYETANWKNIKASLKTINWPEILAKQNSSEEKLRVVLEIVVKIIEENCTMFKRHGGTRLNKIPRDRRILLRKKKKLNLKLQNNNLSNDKKKQLEKTIGEIDKKLLDSHKEEKIVKEAHAIENIKSNPKHFFAYAKKNLKTRSTIGPFEINDERFDNLAEICTKLAEQYSSSFSQPDPDFKIENAKDFYFTDEETTGPKLSDIDFTEKSIINAIKDIKNNSAPGTDRFPAILLKECAEELSEPLYILWRHSLDNGDISPLLKSAVICPILKPGSQRNHPKSYRPVSLTSHIIKVFERIIRTALVKYLEDNNLVPEDQHGFIKGKSTLSQLLNHIEESIRNWEDGKATDTIYLDFAKAFDKVDHDILCHKLKALGITGKLGIWIREFLTGRTQRVSANGLLSDSFLVISGVPQGTVLGPILFIIMICDLGRDLLYSIVSKYADDTKNVAKIGNTDDSTNFQKELNNVVYPWAPNNNMCLNGDKFEHHRIGNNLGIENHVYKDPTGAIIKEKEFIKDLGVHISSDLTWTRQTNEVVSKARSMSGWTMRTFQTREREPMSTIWNSLVRPHLDYCSPLWSPRPSNFQEIDLLEETYRSFTRQITGMDGLDYAQRLKELKRSSIQRRHERFKIIYLYKIKEGLVPNISNTNGLAFKEHIRYGCKCIVPSFPIVGKARKARDNSYAWTASNLWNALPKCVRNITGKKVEFFKKKLDKALAFYPDVPRCGSSGHSYDRNGRKSNSLCDHYRNRDIGHIIDNMINV